MAYWNFGYRGNRNKKKRVEPANKSLGEPVRKYDDTFSATDLLNPTNPMSSLSPIHSIPSHDTPHSTPDKCSVNPDSNYDSGGSAGSNFSDGGGGSCDGGGGGDSGS